MPPEPPRPPEAPDSTHSFSTHTAGEPVTAKPPKARGQSVLAGVAGGAIVAVICGVLVATGVIGGEKIVVQQAAGFGSSSDGDVPTVNDVYRKVGSGVVNIKSDVTTSANSPFGGQQQGTATGSGFVVDKKGYVVTNAHVVNGASKITVQFGHEASVSAKLVGADNSNDLAVLKVNISKDKLHPLELGDSSKTEVGSPVIAIGNPFGLDRTVTTGIVSALQRRIEAPNQFQIDNVIQTDAAINPGNSGGPLLDGRGRVIGVNSQIATSGGSEGNVGIGFAVPVNTVKNVLPDLKDDGKVEYAYLGVSTTELTPAIADRLNLGGAREGALVDAVAPKGPAAKAGLRGGDISAQIDGQPVNLGGDLIVEIDGKKIVSSDAVAAAVTKKKPGETVNIVVIRSGKRKTITVKLGTRPNEFKDASASEGQSPFGSPQP